MPDVLSAGQVHAITQNIIYALPVSRCFIRSQAAVEVSLTTTTTDFVAVAASTTGTETGAAFVRCTTANTNIRVSKA